jgi:dipeptidyl aminopeptidase/acylaminoacyl peptidase
MPEILEIEVKSSLDDSLEKNLFYCPQKGKELPLVVGLHSWSFGRDNQVEYMLPFCVERGWALLLPEFRGANHSSNPRASQACGSRLARQDIVDAVNYILENYPINPEKLLLLGGSGGGHMALMAGAYSPELWLAVSSWCPITDLALWRSQATGQNYPLYIEACCEGAPGSSHEADHEYAERSPCSQTAGLMRIKNLYLHHGRFDQLVPPIHSLMLAHSLEDKGHPGFFFEIFNGGHELRYHRAFMDFDDLLQSQRRDSDKLTG